MFLPTTIKEVRARGWEQLDVILFSGDAYIDHPAFGAAVIGRLLEAEGYRVVSVLCQILKHSGRDEQAFLVSLAGLLMVLFWIVPYCRGISGA